MVAGLLAAVVVLSGCTAPAPEPAPLPTAPPVVTSPSATPSPTPSPLADSGPGLAAQGTVIFDASGKIVAYMVADGDAASGIAARFGLTSLGQIVNADGQKVGHNVPIYAGEELTLLPNRS